MIKTIVIFAVIYLAMIATSFWESCVEGRNTWDKKKLGWKIKLTKRYAISKYHFYLYFIMFPAMLSLPLIVNGWDSRLFGILLSAYSSGIVLEDFIWFKVNPVVKLSEWNPKFANYYPWIKIGELKLPLYYLIGIAISVLSWYFLWRQ